jgi:hypothetical protein
MLLFFALQRAQYFARVFTAPARNLGFHKVPVVKFMFRGGIPNITWLAKPDNWPNGQGGYPDARKMLHRI